MSVAWCLASCAALTLFACTEPPVAAPAPHDVHAAEAVPEERAAGEALAGAIAPAAIPDAAEVLAREQRWRGGEEKLHAISDLTFEGSINSDSVTGTMWEAMTVDGYLRGDVTVEGDQSFYGVDAQGAWNCDAGGPVHSLPNVAVAVRRFDVRKKLGRLLDEDVRAGSTYMGRITIDSVECDRVRLSGAEPGITQDDCVAADGKLIASCFTSDGHETWTRYSQWGEVNGCRFPFRESLSGKQTASRTWTSVRANVGWQEVDLRRVSDISVWRPVLESEVTIPIDLFEGHFVFVSGEVQGWPADILLDTGASNSVIDHALANTLGIGSDNEGKLHGASGSVTASLAREVSVRLGAFQLPTMEAVVTDLSDIQQLMNRRIQLVLGMDLFRRLPVTIDYAGRTITLHDPKRFHAPASSVAVPVHVVGRAWMATIDAQILDLEPVQLLLDTGSANEIDLSQKFVSEHSLLQRFPRQVDRPVIGMGGESAGKLVILDEFKLADHVFHDVPTIMSVESKGQSELPKVAGAIGTGLFSRYVVTFDLPHRSVYFQPGSTLDAPFEMDRLGLFCRVKEDRIVVDLVLADRPAAKAGIVQGDEIVKVDGVASAPNLLFTRLRQVRLQPAGTVVRLGMKDGRELVITLANYF